MAHIRAKMTGFCEHGTKLYDSLNGENFGGLNICQLLK